MSHKLVKVENLKLSKELLNRFNLFEGTESERELETSRLKWVRYLLVSQTFNRCDWAVCKCIENGKVYRVNGNTTKTCLLEVLSGDLPATFPDNIPVALQHWECDSLSDLLEVFDNFDNHHSSRKAKDKSGVYLAAHYENAQALPRGFIHNILRGVAYGHRQFKEVRDHVSSIYMPKSMHDVGNLLNCENVKDFVDRMLEPDTRRIVNSRGNPLVKNPVVAEFFRIFLTEDRENFDLILKCTMYEVGKEASSFLKELRKKTPIQSPLIGDALLARTKKYTDSLLKSLHRMSKEEKAAMDAQIQQTVETPGDMVSVS